MKGGRFFAKKNQVDDRDSDYDRAYRRLLESFEKLTERIKRRNGDNRRSRKVRRDSCFISIVLCILWSVVWWLITANEKIYSVIKMPVWILLLGIALLILGSMIYRVLHDCTRYWEGHSNGFNDN